MSFGEDIKIIRRKMLLSQEVFAQLIGVSFSTVNRWEKGKTKPSYKAMKAIKDYCEENDVPFHFEEYFNEKRRY